MTKQLRQKQERIIEAVRRGLEGDAAVEFVRQSGYVMTQAGVARNLRKMGGRGRVQELIDAGHSNVEILQTCLPGLEPDELPPVEKPAQGDLFGATPASERTSGLDPVHTPLFDTTRLTVKLPADVYEALRLAAKAENMTQNQLVVEILTSALSRMPTPPWDEDEDDQSNP